MSEVWNGPFELLVRQAAPLLPDCPLDPDVDLVASGLDSLGSVQLLLDLEAAYEITIPDELLTNNLFTTPGKLWSVVRALTHNLGGNRDQR